MEPSKKPLFIGITLVIVIAVVLGILWTTGILEREKAGEAVPVEEPETSKLLSPVSAYEIALVKAKEWQPDAMLAQSNSEKEKTDKFGHSDDWQFLFVSKSLKNKGYQVFITNRVITRVGEVPFVGEGRELPPDLISQEEAIAYVHSLTGYEDQEVLSIELYYNKDANEWRWGVKTPKGTVSFKASR